MGFAWQFISWDPAEEFPEEDTLDDKFSAVIVKFLTRHTPWR